MTDGGRRDYGINEGKAIQFHTQGFDKQSCEYLAQALRERYEWNCNVKEDYSDNSKNNKYYLIQVEASSFESVMEVLDGRVLDTFKNRLPKPRKSREKSS